MGFALLLQVPRCSLVLFRFLFSFLSCFVLNNLLIALGSIVRFEARTINEYIITVSVSEK